MFVRRKHNKSGSCSIQVVAKVDGKYRVQKSFGSSSDEAVLASLEQKAKQWANEHEFGEDLFAPDGAADYDAMMAGIGQDQLRLVGPDLIMPKEKVDKGDYWKIAAASLVGLFIPQMTFLMAITLTSAIDTAIIGTLGPIFTMFFAFFFLGEPITGKKAGGVALSFAGILFLIFNSVHAGGAAVTSPRVIVLLLVNILSFSLYLGLFRPLISKYSVVTLMKWTFLFSLIVSLPISAKDLVSTDFMSIPITVRWEIGYLIFFATFVAYFLIPYGQKFIRPTLVSMYSYVQPIIAAIVSILSGIDTLTWQKALASTLVVGGVILVSRSRAATIQHK